MKRNFTYIPLLLFFVFFPLRSGLAQQIWQETFDAGSPTVGDWNAYVSSGDSKNSPTGTYNTNLGNVIANQPCNNFFIIDNTHVPDTSNGQVGLRQICVPFGAQYDPTNAPGYPNNRSLHITYREECAVMGPSGYNGMSEGFTGADAYDFKNEAGMNSTWSSSDQMVTYGSDIDATGFCELEVSFHHYSGGGPRTDRDVLYSTDGGTNWKLAGSVNPNTGPEFGTCMAWTRYSVVLPSDADNAANLRIGFRWRNENDGTTFGDQFYDAGFNLDNVKITSLGDPPNVDFSTPTNACVGLPSSFTNGTNPIADATGFVWSTNPSTGVSISDSTATDALITFNDSGTYDISLKAYLCNGDSITVTKAYSPAACPPETDFSIGADRCRELPIALTNSTDTQGFGSTTYEWSVTSAPGGSTWQFNSAPTGTPVTTEDASFQANTNGSYTIKLKASTPGQPSDSLEKTMTIGDCPPNVVMNLGDEDACATSPAPPSGSTTTISLNSSGTSSPKPITSYSWSQVSGPGTATFSAPAAASTTVSFDSPGAYTVRLRVENSEGSATQVDTLLRALSCECASYSNSQFLIWEEDFESFTSGGPTGWTRGGSGNPVEASPSVFGLTDLYTNGSFPNDFYVGTGTEGKNAATQTATGNSLFISNDQVANFPSGSFSVTPGEWFYTGENDGCSTIFGSGDVITNAPVTDKFTRSDNIPINNATTLGVSFDYAQSSTDLAQGSGRVYYRTSPDGTTWSGWTELPQPSPVGTGCGGRCWNRYSATITGMPVGTQSIQLGFRWSNNDTYTGNCEDFSCGLLCFYGYKSNEGNFAVDNIKVLGELAALGGTVIFDNDAGDNNWHTPANWSTDQIPTSNDPVEIPAGETVAITATDASGYHVCNSGTIQIGTAADNRSLFVAGNLFNHGTITTPNANPATDVAFVGTRSAYTGDGTTDHVDVEVAFGDLELLANLDCRSFSMNDTLRLNDQQITVKRNLEINTDNLFLSPGVSAFKFNGPYTSGPDQNDQQTFTMFSDQTIPQVVVDKSAGKVSLGSNVQYSIITLLDIRNGTLDANTRTLNGAGALNIEAGGQLWISKASTAYTTVLPEITGSYNLQPGSKIRFYAHSNASPNDLQVIRRLDDYQTLEIDGDGTKVLETAADSLGVQEELIITQSLGSERNSFNLQANKLHGAGTLTMNHPNAELSSARSNALFPGLSGALNLSDGTLRLAGNQNQTLKAGTYAALDFAGQGYKSLSGNVTVNNRIDINNSTTLAADTHTFAGPGTLRMSQGDLRIAKTGTALPEVTGPYNLVDATNNRFVGRLTLSGNGTQNIRDGYDYNTISIPSTGQKTLLGPITLNDSLIISGNATLQDAGYAMTGSANTLMTDGTWQLDHDGATVPALTGDYDLRGGTIDLNGANAQTLLTLPKAGSSPYHHLEISGGGIKTLSADTTVVSDSLTLALSSYVDATANNAVLRLANSSPQALQKSDGWIVGRLMRQVNANGRYQFPLGYTDDEESSYLTLNNLIGVASITGDFNTTPALLSILPIISEEGTDYAGIYNRGFWRFKPNAQPTSGTYALRVNPSPAWNFGGQGTALVKRSLDLGQPWGWHGSNKITGFYRRNYSDFSRFSLAKGDPFSPLPIEAGPLTAEAQPQAQAIRLEWKTYSEKNNKGFFLQRSTDGVHYQTIAFVPGLGNSSSGKTYAYLDEEVNDGITYYYRYRQEDHNGSQSFSQTVSASLGVSNDVALKVYPNPFQERTQFEIQTTRAASLKLDIYGATGKKIQEINRGLSPAGSHTLSIDAKKLGLSQGAYFYRLQVGDQLFTGTLLRKK